MFLHNIYKKSPFNCYLLFFNLISFCCCYGCCLIDFLAIKILPKKQILNIYEITFLLIPSNPTNKQTRKKISHTPRLFFKWEVFIYVFGPHFMLPSVFSNHSTNGSVLRNTRRENDGKKEKNIRTTRAWSLKNGLYVGRGSRINKLGGRGIGRENKLEKSIKCGNWTLIQRLGTVSGKPLSV